MPVGLLTGLSDLLSKKVQLQGDDTVGNRRTAPVFRLTYRVIQMTCG
ncbi:MAG: hypothetical protein HGA63_07205 [Syntrophobacteraceae bacterium]|nr:hypothetical protein [Syntrophobacteraceae bacterium]